MAFDAFEEGPALELNRGEAERFLRALDPSAETWTFQTFDDDRERKAANRGHDPFARVFHGTLDEHWPELTRLNRKGAGIFVTINETDGRGRGTKNIKRVRAVFADHDDPSRAPTKPPLKPHIVVDSSPGKSHRYWLSNDVGLDEFTSLQKALSGVLGTDGGVCDLPRVMRLPGFFHQKGKPHLVTIRETTERRKYKAGQLRQAFKAQPTAANDSDAWSLEVVPEYIRRYVSGLASSANDDLTSGLGIEHTKSNVERFRSAASVLDLDDEWTYRRFVWSCRAMGEAWQDECRRACELRSEKFDQGVFDGDWARGDIERISERWVFTEAARLGWQEPQTATSDESGLVEVDLSSFERLQPEPVESLLGAYLPVPHVTLLGGHGGSGKSFLSLIWAVHVALGEPWGGVRTKAGRVLFLSLEDGADVLLWRLRKVVDGYGLGERLDELRASISLVDGSKSDGALVREVFVDGVRDVEPTSLFRQFEQKASEFKPDLIIIDNASDAFAANEIQRQAVRKFIRILARLGEQHNAAVLLLAHIDKNAAKNGANGNSYSGSTQWHNSTRSRVAFVDNQIVHEKSNHSKLADALPVYWDENAGVFKPDPGGSQRQLIQAQKSQSDDDAVLAAMIAVHSRGENLPSTKRGPSTLWHAIRGGLPETLQADTGEAKRRVHEAADRLHEAGKLEASTFKGGNRSNRNGWKPV